MWKSGIIVGIGAFVLAFAASAGISPLCGMLCVAPIAGLVAGYLAGVFDRPVSGGDGAKSGALGGLIGGVGAFLGQVVAGVVNAMFAPQLAELMGTVFSMPADVEVTRIAAIGWGVCGGVADIVLMAALGALGGYLWWQITGSKAVPAAPPPLG
jgi:hypothetical protein